MIMLFFIVIDIIILTLQNKYKSAGHKGSFWHFFVYKYILDFKKKFHRSLFVEKTSRQTLKIIFFPNIINPLNNCWKHYVGLLRMKMPQRIHFISRWVFSRGPGGHRSPGRVKGQRSPKHWKKSPFITLKKNGRTCLSL